MVFKDYVLFIKFNSLTPFHNQNTQLSHLQVLDSSGFVDETMALVSVLTFRAWAWPGFFKGGVEM